MLSNDYSSRNAFKEKSSWSRLKDLDTNQDKNISINELKNIDGNHDGVLQDLELHKAGITDLVVQDKVNSKTPNMSKINPLDNRTIFSNKFINENIEKLSCAKNELSITTSLECISSPNDKPLNKIDSPNHRISEDIHNKYLKIKTLLDPKHFDTFEKALNKLPNKEILVNDFLDNTLYIADAFSMDDAYSILSTVESKVPHIADKIYNDPDRNEVLATVFAIARVSGNRIYNNTLLKGFDFKNKDEMTSIAKTSEYLTAGNCGELAATGAYEAKKIRSGKVEFFSVQYSSNPNNNHVFLVLNRAKNSNSDDPTSWGKKAIVLDTWTKEAYPAKDFYHSKVMKGTIPKYEGEYKN